MIKRMAVLLLVCIFLTSCIEPSISKSKERTFDKPIGNVNLKGTSFENLLLPSNYNIRKFEGTTLNFIVENNLYANILSHENEEFSKLTGINIKIKAVDFDTLIQKINLDFIGKSGKYQLVYVDPYQTLNRFYDYIEVLNPYINNKNLPQAEGFPDDFFESQTTVSSYFKDDKNLYTVPFDSTTMILYYRKDIFDKYRYRFMKEKGYDWTPGNSQFTWTRYYEVAKWIGENVPNEEVRYGSGLMAEQHNSIFCEFSNILASYGGDYFSDEKINTLGLKNFNKINVLDKNFTEALDMYKKIASVSAPQSVNWNWTDLAREFRNGQVAMMANWDENYTYVEDQKNSKVAGKVGYAILPYGDTRSANIYGGSGIGINKYATDDEKQAAWLYIVWATSKDMQLNVLNHPEGGSVPTRKSAYQEAQLNKLNRNSETFTNKDVMLKHMDAVFNAWRAENIYLRPKLSNFYDVEKILIRNLHNMIEFDLDSRETGQKIYKELENINR
ncbi:extracellular solute-binding protein [Bacillus sp. FJAT-27445]|uniref:extracellular solute-binding protein n=1 Tax=Bacillus sp. FJAT-27445 TaxID=1679166 RepID=UPI0007439335|nr:extracellular solute-binding protein [Bacillus sp. FJAT-27445]